MRTLSNDLVSCGSIREPVYGLLTAHSDIDEWDITKRTRDDAYLTIEARRCAARIFRIAIASRDAVADDNDGGIIGDPENGKRRSRPTNCVGNSSTHRLICKTRSSDVEGFAKSGIGVLPGQIRYAGRVSGELPNPVGCASRDRNASPIGEQHTGIGNGPTHVTVVEGQLYEGSGRVFDACRYGGCRTKTSVGLPYATKANHVPEIAETHSDGSQVFRRDMRGPAHDLMKACRCRSHHAATRRDDPLVVVLCGCVEIVDSCIARIIIAERDIAGEQRPDGTCITVLRWSCLTTSECTDHLLIAKLEYGVILRAEFEVVEQPIHLGRYIYRVSTAGVNCIISADVPSKPSDPTCQRRDAVSRTISAVNRVVADGKLRTRFVFQNAKNTFATAKAGAIV